MTTKKALYEADYVLWLQRQVLALREDRLRDLDVENLAEEIEGLARSEKRALRSHLRVLLLHLLKWTYQPDRRSRSWQASIHNAREEIWELIHDSPSLESYANEVLQDPCFERARAGAAEETGIPLSAFPQVCPYTVVQVLHFNFLPGEDDIQVNWSE